MSVQAVFSQELLVTNIANYLWQIDKFHMYYYKQNHHHSFYSFSRVSKKLRQMLISRVPENIRAFMLYYGKFSNWKIFELQTLEQERLNLASGFLIELEFYYLCRKGSWQQIIWYTDYFGMTMINAQDMLCKAFYNCIKNDQFTRAYKLAKTFHLRLHYSIIDAFQDACGQGWLIVAQWIAQYFSFQRHYLRRGGDNCALRVACGNGHLSIVQWLVHTFDLQMQDIDTDWIINREIIAWMGQQWPEFMELD